MKMPGFSANPARPIFRWMPLLGIVALALHAMACVTDDHGGEDTVAYLVRLSAHVDLDGDGFSSDDCDDQDASVHPLAREAVCDGIDQDCDGADATDGDGDGFECSGAQVDCNDSDAAIYPGALEIEDDGIDQDCSGEDTNAATPSPLCEGLEIIDGRDNDCDGMIDEVPYSGEMPANQVAKAVPGGTPGGAFGASLIAIPQSLAEEEVAVLVGAPESSELFHLIIDPSTPSEEVKANRWTGEEGSHFGLGLGVLSSYQGLEAIVGAPSARSSAGEVWVIPLAEESPSSKPTLLTYGTEAGGSLGLSVSAEGDFNEDAYPDLLLGAPYATGLGGEAGGVAYLWLGRTADERMAGSIGESSALIIEGEKLGSRAGMVVMQPDLDADGHTDLLVTAPGGGEEGVAGQVGVFFQRNRRWGGLRLEQADLLIKADESDATAAEFGSSVAFCDFDGNGKQDLLIGAKNATSSQGTGAGRVALFFDAGALRGVVGSTLSGAHLLGTYAGEGVGASLSCGVDLNADGIADLLVGAPGYDDGRGAVYLVYGGTVTQGVELVLTQGSPRILGESGDRLGLAVQLTPRREEGASVLILGAPGDSLSMPGRVYYADTSGEAIP